MPLAEKTFSLGFLRMVSAISFSAASVYSRQRDHVSSVTTCPRAARREPSASIGKAWPGSPKAPSSTRSGWPAAAFHARQPPARGTSTETA